MDAHEVPTRSAWSYRSIRPHLELLWRGGQTWWSCLTEFCLAALSEDDTV